MKGNTMLNRLLITVLFLFPLTGAAVQKNNNSFFEQTYVCVSFSMSDETLKTLFAQAQKLNATLVMKGLYKNSFQETRKKMESLKINVIIDPNVYDHFKVTLVPTVIAIKEETAYKTSGNVSLARALDHLSEEARRT